MGFAQIAKELREDTGLSQQKLGEKLGISSSGIGHLEVGDCEPNSTTLLAYAKYFDVSADYLLGLEDETGAKVVTTAPILSGYSSEERKLIDSYRELNASGKRLVNETMRTLLATSAGSEKRAYDKEV